MRNQLFALHVHLTGLLRRSRRFCPKPCAMDLIDGAYANAQKATQFNLALQLYHWKFEEKLC